MTPCCTPLRRAGLAAFTGLAACGTPVGNPDPFFPPTEVTNFNGHYAISHTFSVPGTAHTSGCVGEADLLTNSVFAFGGTIDIDGAGSCSVLPDREGEVLGSVRDEEITFSVAGIPDPLTVIGCSLVGGGRSFQGTFTTRPFGESMRVQSFRGTLDAQGICEGDPDPVPVRWEIRASRR